MSEFRESFLLLVSAPVYTVVILIEIFFSRIHGKKLYSARGVLENIYLTVLNMSIDIAVRALCLAVLYYAYRYSFMSVAALPLLYWTLLILFEDFMFYWLHRVDHHCRLFWAIHVTHHSSEEFNLTVGFRSSVLQPLYRFVYFIPLALCGFQALDIMFAYSAAQIVGILAHTQTVNKLGFLEYIFVTPSHHRVHHASNVKYLDRNMGMLFIFWDKLSGTFQAEEKDEKIRFGLTHNVSKTNPVKLIFHEWQQIFEDLRKKDCTLSDKFMYVFGPPGWSHDNTRRTSAQLKREQWAENEQNGNHRSDQKTEEAEGIAQY